jgi:hypothetical protein
LNGFLSLICFRLSLIFTLNKSYPKAIPLIEVSDVKGLSNKEVDELKSILCQTANDCIGEVMIHEIAIAAENYLEDHNRKPETLHEQMQNRQRNAAAALKDIKEGSLFPENTIQEKKNKEIEDGSSSEALPAKVPLDLRKQAHGGERAGSVGCDGLDEDWLQSLLKRQHGINIGGLEGDELSDEETSGSVEKTTYQQADGSNSRYQKEFQEITLLGKGAGGEVWKVKNSLDRRAYAIKKIILNPTNETFNRKIRREVTTISRLLHKNIVRYYAAWMEDVVPVEVSRDEAAFISLPEFSSSGLLQHYLPQGNNALNFNVEQFQDLNLDFDVHDLGCNDSCSESDSEDSSLASEDSSTSSSSEEIPQKQTLPENPSWGHIEFIDSASDDSNHKSVDGGACLIDDENDQSESVSKLKARLPTRFLYIQMEFCDATLRAAIDGGLLLLILLGTILKLIRKVMATTIGDHKTLWATP